MPVIAESFGTYPDGREITLYTISNSKGMQVSVTNIGAALVKIICSDRDGQRADVVLGFDRGEDYLKNPSFFGAVIGPNANRTGGASFELDGKVWQLDVNDGPNRSEERRVGKECRL